MTKNYKSKQINNKNQSNNDKASSNEPVNQLNNDPSKDSNNKVNKKSNILGDTEIICRHFSIDTLKTITYTDSYDDIKNIPSYNIPEIAFIGRSNVGKSSLLNMLSNTNKALAIVSKTPGRTRLINMFNVKDKDGDICILVDLPGYGYAKMSKEEQKKISLLLQDYFIERDGLRLVIVLIDPRREIQQSDNEIIQFLEDNEIDFIVVATKCDKLTPYELTTSLSSLKFGYNLPEGQPIPVSSVTGLGKKEIWKYIRSGILNELENNN